MSTLGPISEDEARENILQWGRLNDLRLGLSAFLPMIASEGFFMRFGEKVWVGYADFEAHQIMKSRRFDEINDCSAIHVAAQVPATTAKTVMLWTYRHRPENSPTSQLLKARFEHTWECRCCPSSRRALMEGHVADLFEYLVAIWAISGEQPPHDDDPHLDPRWRTR